MKCLREPIWTDTLENEVCMELSMTLVSVVIPCYNVENYIEDCLYSIFNQTYKNKEVLLELSHSSTFLGKYIRSQ